jgi:hypothetical protein
MVPGRCLSASLSSRAFRHAGAFHLTPLLLLLLHTHKWLLDAAHQRGCDQVIKGFLDTLVHCF